MPNQRGDPLYRHARRADYAELTDTVAQALNDVSQTQDASSRLRIVERARKTLATGARAFQLQAEGSASDARHVDSDRRPESIGRLGSFDLSFVAATDAADIREPLLSAPTPREAIDKRCSRRADRLVD